MLYVDAKYANMLAPRLRNFKHKGNYLWNFSCPVCGDSSKNKTKARGYIYKVKTGLFVKCHNCGYGSSVGNFIKYIDPNLHQEYVLEHYKEQGAVRPTSSQPIPDIFRNSKTIAVIDNSVLDGLRRLDSLLPNHPVLDYIRGRKIPVNKWSLLYFAPKFKNYVNTIVPGKFKDSTEDHPRLIIPFFNSRGECFAFQGRAFGKEDPKYYTIKVGDNDEDKIFGLDRVNHSERIYITEGPLDSLFIPNAIAVSGSSFNSPSIEELKMNATVVYDNEPRSKDLTKLIKKTIDQGFSVCLWPESVEQKDINEMILAGRTSQDILDIINQNTYSGAMAQLRFASWKKCE